MSELASIQAEVHSLGKQIAGIQPMVEEVHLQMPRIAGALETLAAVSAKLENNVEDHKRIHYRITGLENVIKTEIETREELALRFDMLKDEHIVCVTTAKVERKVERTSWWSKAKDKASEKTVELVMLAIIGFVGWMVLSHLKEYSPTAQIMKPQPAHEVNK